jgi:hypothetical protein
VIRALVVNNTVATKVREREDAFASTRGASAPQSECKQNDRWIQPARVLFWRCPIDSHVPTCSTTTSRVLTIYLAVPDRSVLLRHAAFRRAVLE